MLKQNTQEELDALRSVLSYDPKTGRLTWKCKPNRFATRVVVGAEAGCFDGNGYRTLLFRRKQYLGHRVAWALHHGRWPGEIDHADGNPSNNRISNLRECSHIQNCMNRLNPVGTSGLRGAVRLPSGKWQAQIKHGGKVRHIGVFPTAEEASSAYWGTKRQLAGNFIRIA